MATIVRLKATQQKFVVLGAGFGLFKTSTDSPIFGSLMPSREQGHEELLAVTDAEGVAGFVPIQDVEVISVDGVTPAEILR